MAQLNGRMIGVQLDKVYSIPVKILVAAEQRKVVITPDQVP
jgi:DNA-binding transcriptional regulator LsrR (DeoR family)